MNRDRRDRLLDAASQLTEAIDTIREVQEEEQEAFFNMPEGFQSGSRGENMQIAIDKMEGFVSQIESVQSDIEDFAKG